MALIFFDSFAEAPESILVLHQIAAIGRDFRRAIDGVVL